MNYRIAEERKYQEMLQRIRGFRLLDDDFMTKCCEDNIEATELGKLMHDFSVIEPEDMITDEKKLTAIRMLKSEKLISEEIAEYLDLSLEVIEELTSNLQIE